ncbi:hypothetical protein CMPELA_31055 [Cupriavidus necator]|uniref:Uncharacterized protein n=1 Tax=Cupriavidus necator (strain ATCC 17699 / DSM 428 / KCTC 22496 / NCIMB 10442 / H16 / Stanier 337) TaxID=381666 RepID=Q0JYK8_CUPNH|nr:hypothetical protein [Cupriavidus necator]QCC04937.1 hypothetical protein E6A55_31220 [Cupriavidus necator H16]QQB79624.1 hypothetical protein I6H87_30770 [Cupriavidus necator]WKA43867.1 hypothetical protein QWP09_31250 [Cupriavidus necator]CAJ97166.1 Hypothetical protein H16_B2384 [Cupriavidus necator H16]
MTLFSFLDRAHLTKGDEKKLRDILNSAEAEEILARVEQTTIDMRKALRQRLDSLDARHDKGIATASATHLKAILAREAAEVQLAAARAEESLTSAASYAVEEIKATEAKELRQALIDSRDDRLDDYYRELDSALGQSRHLTRITSFRHGSWLGDRMTRYESNAEQVTMLRRLLMDALEDVKSMTLEPLSRNEVSERLTAWSHKLESQLNAFSLATPRLDENGAVASSRVPLKFVEVLQANGVAEPGDVPPQKPPAAQPRPTASSVSESAHAALPQLAGPRRSDCAKPKCLAVASYVNPKLTAADRARARELGWLRERHKAAQASKSEMAQLVDMNGALIDHRMPIK